MVEGLEELAKMEYPGRVIILGRDNCGENIVVYGLSGRSESSQARRLVKDANEERISIEVTDQAQLEKGDPALLVYDAITTVKTIRGEGITVVSNGAQTNLIAGFVSRLSARPAGIEMPFESFLPFAFCQPHIMRTKDNRDIDLACYEPDSPNFTPRISGALRDNFGMISIIKRSVDDSPLICFYRFPLAAGQGKMIATYDGPNPTGKGEPIPAFKGEPRDVCLRLGLEDTAARIYEAMGKFVVSVACYNPSKGECAIKNLHEKR